MPTSPSSTAPTRFFWIIGVAGLIWNLIGVITYLMSVTASPEALSALPEAERAIYADVPAWATSSYAVAVFGGTAGCVLLLMRKTLASLVFGVSLAAILLQMGHAFFMTDMIEVLGPTSGILPMLIIVAAVYLLWFSRSAGKKEWLK